MVKSLLFKVNCKFINGSSNFSLGLIKILHCAEKASQQTSEQVNDCCIVVVNFFQANHHRALMNFVEAQAQYYAQCHSYMTELQKQLARYPSS